MSPQNRSGETELVVNSKINKHLIMGYVFLSLVFMGAVSSVYYWEKKALSAGVNNIGVVGSGEQSGTAEPEMCIQMVVNAKNKQTGEVREFPTPCDVNEEWWEIIQN